MHAAPSSQLLIKVGHRDGLGTVYSEAGGLITGATETMLGTSEGWDVEVTSPWRRVLPGMVFNGLGGKVSSKLYVTSERIVLVREIDIWRELKEELTPLGLPTAAAKEIELKKLKAAGVRRYCEISPQDLRIVKAKKALRPRPWLDLRLVGSDGRRYAVTLWKWQGLDEEMLGLLESRFQR